MFCDLSEVLFASDGFYVCLRFRFVGDELIACQFRETLTGCTRAAHNVRADLLLPSVKFYLA